MEATSSANVKERIARRERFGNRLLDQRFIRPEPVLNRCVKHGVAFGARQRRPRASPKRIDVTLPSPWNMRMRRAIQRKNRRRTIQARWGATHRTMWVSTST